MAPILTEEEINRQFRIPYIIAGLIIIGSAATMVYGYTNIPTQIPEYNIQYEVATSLEKKNADLQKYQYSSDQFKIGMSGLGVFLVGIIVCIRCIYLNRARVEKFYERQEQRRSKKIHSPPKQEAVTIHELTVPQQQQQQPRQPLQVQRQPYVPYRGHLPPEYRGIKVLPQL